MNINYEIGLNDEQIAERVRTGKRNITQNHITKTRTQIIKENVCTLFNFLNVIIAVALAIVGAWSNMVFICIISLNIIISIAQELKAKKLVENLSLLSRPDVALKRNGEEGNYSIDEIVLDDIMLLNSGRQICCDSFVLRGEIEVNESLLTGESDPIIKKEGDRLLSGSSVISGKCYAQVEHVGEENYAAKIVGEVKKLKKIHSELMQSMRKVTKLTSFLIIPLGILLFVQAYWWRGDTTFSSVVSSSAALLGMLPKGLVLLISVSLAGGVIRLAKKNVLIQDLHSLESLAHVDVLCLDKTGTLTEGIMKVDKEYLMSEDGERSFDFHQIIGSFLKYSDDNNTTFQALKDHYVENDVYIPMAKIPFSSQRKWSSVTFKDLGTLVVGAPERLIRSKVPKSLRDEIVCGNRVIIVGITEEHLEKDSELPPIIPLAGIVITDHVRENAASTLDYFLNEGVDVKIISGDNPATVSAIAKEAGLHSYADFINMDTIEEQEDFSKLVNQYSIFGRTTPIKKKKLVEALKQNGHCVAMVGDGVNDLLALKEADCSIAVAQGSDAARQISQLVLLDSDFASLPKVLSEGRRVVNNVTRAAGVFFIKTIYSVLLTIACVLLNIPFPFIPIQITVLDALIEAYPAFLTAFEPNHEKIKGRFLTSAIRSALPHAISITISVLFIFWFFNLRGISESQWRTMAYLLVGIISMEAVIISSYPFNILRSFVCSTMVLGYTAVILLVHSLLKIEMISTDYILIFIGLVVAGISIERGISFVINFVKIKKTGVETNTHSARPDLRTR